MNLKEQQYVCALAEQQNITRAAEKLFISQPALSIYIGNLEKMLGVKLFERVGKRFILTYVGEKYVEKAREMLRLEEEFGEEL
ncbi:MAG: LysR family transcriptional regulator, partial [Clostridium sp.]